MIYNLKIKEFYKYYRYKLLVASINRLISELKSIVCYINRIESLFFICLNKMEIVWHEHG
jgi:hypothetical protein